MRGSRAFQRPARAALAIALAFGAGAGWGARAEAQQAQGFAVERFYPSPAGGGWFVMDNLDMHGGFGGAIELTSGYARDPLVLTSGGTRLAVVANEAFVDFAVAATYDRFRLSLNLTSPVLVTGQSGTVAGSQFTAPNVSLASNPDTLSDARAGFDARLFGRPDGAFRLGASAQLLFPSGDRADYVTDDTFRAMLRLLVAGDVGRFLYAGQLGVHIRPLDDAPIPGSPVGSELLFGAAGGPRFSLGPRWDVVLGPELFGETAFNAFFGQTTTGVEGLLSGRLEGTGPGAQLRAKLSVGAGLDPGFGAPEWRIVLAVELFDHQPKE